MDSDVQEVPVTNPAPAADPAPAASDPLEPLEKALENACATLASLGENVIDFSYDSQDVIFNKINEFIKDLQEVDNRCQGVNAVIPLEVVEAIDKGRNPEHVTFQLLESCAEANNVARGKLKAMRAFRDELEKSAEEAEKEEKSAGAKSDGETAQAGDSSAKPSNGFDSMDVS